jgi:hypothetical protein
MHAAGPLRRQPEAYAYYAVVSTSDVVRRRSGGLDDPGERQQNGPWPLYAPPVVSSLPEGVIARWSR